MSKVTITAERRYIYIWNEVTLVLGAIAENLVSRSSVNEQRGFPLRLEPRRLACRLPCCVLFTKYTRVLGALPA